METRKLLSGALLGILILMTLPPIESASAVPLSSASFHFNVVDSFTGAHIKGCDPIILKKKVKVSGGWRWKRVGVFGDGDSKTLNVKKPVFLVRTSKKVWCQGYVFDRWEITGSGITEVKRLSNNRMKIKATDGASITVTLFVKKLVSLDIEVNPPGSGNVKALGRGSHSVVRGSVIKLRPLPNAGWKFDYWTVNGRKVERSTLTIVVDKDYRITAHFSKKETRTSLPSLGAPSTSASPPVVKGCDIDVSSLKYRGHYAELEATKDLLARLPGKAPAQQTGEVLIVGGGKGEPQPWNRLGVELSDGSIEIGGVSHESDRGREYGLVYFDCQLSRVTVTGTSVVGTRAALMWLLNHPDEASGKLLIVVEWVDANYDNQVQDSEIRVVYEVP